MGEKNMDNEKEINGKDVLTVGQLLKMRDILEELPKDMPVKGEFKFSQFCTGYDAVVESVTLELKPEGFSLVMGIRESEKETAALKEAMAA